MDSSKMSVRRAYRTIKRCEAEEWERMEGSSLFTIFMPDST
ncbi:MAG: hypothetical protein WAK17_16525 [Candidatus Nitrosopolaris sp.]